jgi:agmatine deiminase
MITDQQTNTVYFSDYLRKENEERFNNLLSIIEKHGYTVKLLSNTKDIYCRDYMPVQVDKDDFVQFVFRPTAYLKKEQYHYITNPTYVNLKNGLTKPRYSSILLDGGNVIKAKDKVFITSRVINDNLYQFPNENAIIKRLEFDLKCEVIIIPEYPGEETGHADGLIRFIDNNRVFINDTKDEPEKKWLEKFLGVLNRTNLTPIELPCCLEDNQETADGLYINYLQMGKLIVVPQFGDKYEDADKKAVDILENVFGQTCEIVGFNSSWIAKYGGVLNCSSWTVIE